MHWKKNRLSAGIGEVKALFSLSFRDRQEKRTCGYTYHEPIRILHRLDDFLVQERLEALNYLDAWPGTGWQRNRTKV